MYPRLIASPLAGFVSAMYGPCTPDVAVVTDDPGFCPSKPMSRMYFGLAGSLKSKIFICWFVFQPSGVTAAAPAPATSHAMPVSHSHQLLWVAVNPDTGTERSCGLDGSVTS